MPPFMCERAFRDDAVRMNSVQILFFRATMTVDDLDEFETSADGTSARTTIFSCYYFWLVLIVNKQQ